MKADEVSLRPVEDQDLDLFFCWQADPEVTSMAAVSARDRAEFDEHWAKIRADSTIILRTIVADGTVAGQITSREEDGQRQVGYLIGPEHWGRGIATRALALLTEQLTVRPLYAEVAAHNTGSARVLEKCGFRRDPALEAAAPPSDDGVEVFIFVLDSQARV